MGADNATMRIEIVDGSGGGGNPPPAPAASSSSMLPVPVPRSPAPAPAEAEDSRSPRSKRMAFDKSVADLFGVDARTGADRQRPEPQRSSVVDLRPVVAPMREFTVAVQDATRALRGVVAARVSGPAPAQTPRQPRDPDLRIRRQPPPLPQRRPIAPKGQRPYQRTRIPQKNPTRVDRVGQRALDRGRASVDWMPRSFRGGLGQPGQFAQRRVAGLVTARSGAVAGANAAAAMTAVGRAAMLAADGLTMAYRSALEFSERLADLAPESAQAKALADIRQILGDIRRATATQHEMAQIIEMQSRLNNALDDFKAGAIRAAAPIIEDFGTLVRAVTGGAGGDGFDELRDINAVIAGETTARRLGIGIAPAVQQAREARSVWAALARLASPLAEGWNVWNRAQQRLNGGP